jgi:hypothetical protein
MPQLSLTGAGLAWLLAQTKPTALIALTLDAVLG